MLKLRYIAILLSLLLTATMISADVPQVINYQGRLLDIGGIPVSNGTYNIKFIIYESSTGNDPLWNTGFQPVLVTAGLFNYELGSNVTLPHDLFVTSPRYLGISVENDPELTPRIELTSSAYSFQALRSDTTDYAKDIAYNIVTSSKILDFSITGNDIAGNVVESGHIQNHTILFSDIASNGAAEGEVMKMISGNWTTAADETGSGGGDITAVIASTGLDGGGASGDVLLSIADLGVGSLQLGNNSVSGAKIQNNAVYSDHIADGEVFSADIAYGAVSSPHIANNAVTSVKIADGAVNSAKLASNAVLADKLSNNSVTSPKIQDGTIITQDLADNSITSQKILNGTINSIDIAGGGVAMSNIAQSGATSNQAITWNGATWLPLAVGDITSVTPNDLGGLEGGGESGDVEIGIAFNGVTSSLIGNNQILDEDVNASADIEPSKIRGTAVNLNDVQTVTGTKTFDDLSISTTTRRLAISNAAFVPASNTQGYSRIGNYIRNTSAGYNSLYAQVSLPHGAVVTEVRATYYDAEGSYFGKMELLKVYMYSGSEIKMAECQTATSSGLTNISSTTITSSSISNESYNYYLISTMSYSLGMHNMRLYGAEIIYTITKPLP